VNVLGPIDWCSATMGHCECPGKSSHGSKNGAKDCTLYLDRVPTVTCFHASCKSAVDAANKRLRAAILNPDNDVNFSQPRLTAEDRERQAERERMSRRQQRARKALPRLMMFALLRVWVKLCEPVWD